MGKFMLFRVDFLLRMEKISVVYSEGRVVVPAQNEANSLYLEVLRCGPQYLDTLRRL